MCDYLHTCGCLNSFDSFYCCLHHRVSFNGMAYNHMWLAHPKTNPQIFNTVKEYAKVFASSRNYKLTTWLGYNISSVISN